MDQPTRDRVSREILQQGPVTARDLAETLGLTPAAVRRHLDGLEAQGLVEVHSSSTASDGSPRGRGRPARRYVLSDSGHATMSAEYDHLAAHVLEYLARTAGPEAVAGFARERAERLAARYRPAVEAAGPGPGSRAQALAGVLSEDGYAAAVRSNPRGATQLCQGHCPVQHVAARFPQLCEAETQAFSTLLGVHVQRLATLAHGEHVCTTHVPAPLEAPVSREKRADDHRVAS
ncbi:helix-turn-helix transcriptional regulator [Spongisporangium articulatum]|uniref:Helix-turn-helix transcriptional regulator n=1 Tax=Spongisporangium articulatum TaxID=3362603 RepID=A0ABW8ARL7_9ACTN